MSSIGEDARRRHRGLLQDALRARPADAPRPAPMISSSASWCPLRARVVGEARIVGQLGLAHGAARRRKRLSAMRRDVDVGAVGRGIEVVWRAADQARAGAVRDEAELVVGGNPRLHEVEGALVERRVDELAVPGLLARHQRHHRAESAMQAGDVVGHGDADARGRAVGIAGQVPQAAHRLANHAVARAAGNRGRPGRSPRCAP